MEITDYQGMGIAGKMIEYMKEKYKDFMYIEGMPEDKNNVSFYEKHGFSRKFSPFIVIPISSFPTCSIESL
ncbi:GNAT family N-acetyltransferase [Eubacterium ramulus]|uniref:GNAT family N-acetyltransferase n=2 Tax=Eubacterium ramulus TaxID=39490 RepID=UPI0015AAAA91|nr:GNAT family N-acetyltransferase [uncultured Eubacterium sp.]